MNRYLAYIAALALFLISGADAHAANCSAYPYTLTNGQVADANQVMADFNSILSCGNNNLLGKNNNLSDVQSTSTSRTNLGLGAAAVENLSNATSGAVVDDGSGNLVISSYPGVHSQTFTSSGTFTVPSGATSSTLFKFTVVGGGGSGASGRGSGGDPGSGGGSGGAGFAIFSGFSASESVTITIGSGGSSPSGANGNAGNDTTVVANSATIITAGGGAGGTLFATPISGGDAGSFSAGTAGGRTMQSSSILFAAPGAAPYSNAISGSVNALTGAGGSNVIGVGGKSTIVGASADSSGNAGVRGGGGSGGVRNGTGGAGGNGAVIVEWVL